jgi:hypothetical protein
MFPYYVYNILSGIEEDGKSVAQSVQMNHSEHCALLSPSSQVPAPSTPLTLLEVTNVKPVEELVLLRVCFSLSWTTRYVDLQHKYTA